MQNWMAVFTFFCFQPVTFVQNTHWVFWCYLNYLLTIYLQPLEAICFSKTKISMLIHLSVYTRKISLHTWSYVTTFKVFDIWKSLRFSFSIYEIKLHDVPGIGRKKSCLVLSLHSRWNCLYNNTPWDWGHTDIKLEAKHVIDQTLAHFIYKKDICANRQ